MPKLQASDVTRRLGLEEGKFFLVSAHREENVDSQEALGDLLNTLEVLADKYDFPVIVSTHPRTRKRIEAMGLDALDSRIQFLKPFGFFDYNRLQLDAFCILSDSGTITEEASLLNLPAITLRNAHERPEGMDVGTLIMSGLKSERVLESVEVVTSQYSRTKRVMAPVADYEAHAVSKQIIRVVLSYVDYINRTVWRKSI
jgi:UDP-N-acetylglucosamine 2-epimerase (non-hydrolysing)